MTDELRLFLEDMDEQLSTMENTLLDISDISLEEIDSEMINALFRAMHTMKGNAGMFGYEEIVEFSHIAENLLDEIRNGKINITQEMVDTFLLVKDHSKLLVEVYTNDNQLNSEQKEYHNNLIKTLSGFLDLADEKKEQKVEVEEEIISPSNDGEQKYEIYVKVKDAFFSSGMELLSIIRYLGAIGNVEHFKIIEEKIPSLEQLDIKKSYIEIEIIYETDEPENEIYEAFEFVQEDIELKITLIETQEKTEPQIDLNSIKTLEENDEKKSDEPIIVELSNKPEIKEEQKSKLTQAGYTLKVDSTKVDKLINQISEMVIANAKVTQYAKNSNDTDFEEAVAIISEMLEEVRNGIMNIKMVQVGDSLSKLRRIVNDTAKKIGKEISFNIIGGETELDKTVIEKITDPLVHMLRNSIDHGVELPHIRKENGKNPKGNITLKAYPDAGTIVIKIIDDGAGIDKDIIFNKAVEKGIIESDESLSDKEIFNLLFAPGFSTAKKVTDISGRGVGMDVVKRNIEDLRGSVEIDSVLTKGTTITVRLPLTLAIIDGFLVQCGKSKYIIPLDNIQECIELTNEAQKQIQSKGYISLRSNILPILDVLEYFGEENIESNKRKNIVVVNYGSSKVGFKVDELYGEFQTVIKPLGELFKNVPGISGGTILGNGEIALIFDVQKLIEDKITYKDIDYGN